MKIFTTIWTFLLFISYSYAQTYFQRVTNDPIVQNFACSVNSAWGDYDNDGYQDLVVCPYTDSCTNCLFPILIFHNNGNGTFTRVTNNVIAQTYGRFIGVCWGDYDNDGKLDLFCGSRYGTNMLFHNDGNGNFTRITTGVEVNEGGFSTSCSWCDYDRDGWLDLFVANSNYVGNYLYHNINGIFTKVTSGPIVNDFVWSRGSAWGDYDNDGWPDLFVVTYQGENDLLYHNNGNGIFTKITSGPVVNDGQWGTQCAWGDYDNDGFLDLFVTNDAGSGRLYHNNGNGSFTLMNNLPSQTRGIGVVWGDYDNDGYIDLYIGRYPSTNYLFKNNSGNSFSNAVNEVVVQDPGSDGSWVDYNNNGKLDLFSSHPNYSYLYQNVGPTGNYLICKLKGCQSNRSAIGARIKIKYGNQQKIREVTSGDGNENMLWQHFGLGTVNVVDSVIVLWPYGPTEHKQVVTNVPANSTITIDECNIGIKRLEQEIPTEFALSQNYPNPFNPTTKIKFSIPLSRRVSEGRGVSTTLIIYDILGREVATLVNEKLQPGTYEVEFDGTNFPSGVYFYKIEPESFNQTRRMVLIK